MPDLGPNLRAAIRDARIPHPDSRGLMPLTEARAWLAGQTAIERGEGTLVDGTFVLPSDTTWAALLSLADAGEFTTHARRLDWRMWIRGRDNLAPVERYGDGVLPWIASRVDDAGVLDDVPRCVLPCLLVLESEAAFDLAARIRGVRSAPDFGPGLGGVRVLALWTIRHQALGHRLLAERAGAADPVAQRGLRQLHTVDPYGTVQRLEAAVGTEVARALLDRLALPEPALPEPIARVLAGAESVDVPPGLPVSLAELDERYDEFDCPSWDSANFFCAAMRMTGFADPGGTDGLVIQSLVTGLGDNSVRLEFHRFGLDRSPGTVRMVERVLVPETEIDRWLSDRDEVAVSLPDGELRLRVTQHPRFGTDLGPVETVMVRLAELPPDRFFAQPADMVSLLDLPGDAVPLFTLDHWRNADPEELPSESADFQLAAEALRQRRAITSSVTGLDWHAQIQDRLDLYRREGLDW